MQCIGTKAGTLLYLITLTQTQTIKKLNFYNFEELFQFSVNCGQSWMGYHVQGSSIFLVMQQTLFCKNTSDKILKKNL